MFLKKLPEISKDFDFDSEVCCTLSACTVHTEEMISAVLYDVHCGDRLLGGMHTAEIVRVEHTYIYIMKEYI